jgi:Ca-activated chloride channel family protein
MSKKPPTRPDAFGLIAWLEQTRIVLPLKAVDVSFDVCGDLAEVYLDQVFHQTASRPLDVLYTFPLPAEAAIFRCELIVNDRVIQARVEEQARAKEIAKTMKEAGHRTSLVEMERDNLFTLSLGNVQPDDLIVVRFAWFQVLDHSQDTKSLLIPFTPGVRYIPGKPLLRSNRGKGSADDTDQVPDASRITPPRIDELHPDAALISLRGKLDARFLDKNSVSSATHTLILRDEQERLQVTLPQQGHVPDRDFVLRWKEEAAKSLELRSISCVDQDYQYAVIRLDAPADAPVLENHSRDYYFLIDRSGSMEGRKWTCTAQALRAFICELGDLDRVWVTLFETNFQDFAEAPLPVSDLKNDPAFNALEVLGVEGGTELLPALEHVLKQMHAHSKGRDPVVILVTDGQVGNEEQVTKLLRDHSDLAIHTFGIDSAVNGAFLKQVAAQHRGACVLMTPDDDIQGAVSRLGNRLRRPVLTSLTIPANWQIASSHLPEIYVGEHIIIALRGPTEATRLELSGQVADKSRRIFPFNLKSEPIVAPRLLWVRQTMDRFLAQGQKTDAVELAIKHNLICEGAAFIAYDVQEKVALSTEEIYQPVIAPCASALTTSKCTTPKFLRIVEAPKPSMSLRVVENHPTGGLERFTDISELHPKVQEAETFDITLQLDEIEKSYMRCFDSVSLRSQISEQVTLRTQILLDKWRKQAHELLIFSGYDRASELLQDILCYWAKDDMVHRLELLNVLLERGKVGIENDALAAQGENQLAQVTGGFG